MSNTNNPRLTVPVNESDHILGPQDARVTVVKYGDFECPDCAKSHHVIEKMTRELQEDVRLVYRHFPLVNVHPHALRAAEAAEAAAAQGKFWEMHNLLFTNPNELRDKDLRKHAMEIRLDLDRFDDEMARGVHAQKILKNRDLSITQGITGTPTIFVNDELWAMSGIELVEAITALVEQRVA
jgi:protein-disulfide isomerase